MPELKLTEEHSSHRQCVYETSPEPTEQSRHVLLVEEIVLRIIKGNHTEGVVAIATEAA